MDEKLITKIHLHKRKNIGKCKVEARPYMKRFFFLSTPAPSYIHWLLQKM